MERIDENHPTIEIPSPVQILMINEQAEEIVIQDPQEILPEQLLLMEALVTLLKRAVDTENTASGESQSTSNSETSASSEIPSASSEIPSASSEIPSASSEIASASSEIPSAEKLRELGEGVHRAIRTTIEDPSYRSHRQSFSVEISYSNFSLNVNIDAQGNSN